MAKGVPHRDETRVRAIALLRTGATIAEVVRECDISPRTAYAWRERYVQEAAVEPEQLEQLLLTYASSSLETMIAQARQARSRAWLKRQSAADLAAYHAATVDRLLRVLGALQIQEAQD